MITKFYKSYVELRNKKPTSKRKSRTINYKWEEVGGFISDDYVLVDIDDKVNTDLFFNVCTNWDIKCHITASTHGIHAIFRKPSEPLSYGNRKETLTGIICDYKCSNNKGYERIIKDSKPLEVIEECEEPDVLPWLLFPFGKNRCLQQMKHGNGRHKMHLDLSNVYAIYENDPNKILNTIKWVNENVFEEPRKSVNIKISDVLDSIRYMSSTYTDEQLYDMIKNVDATKLIKLCVQFKLIDEGVFR